MGEPDAVYCQYLQPGEQVILVYKARPGVPVQIRDGEDRLFTLVQFKTSGFFRKVIYPTTIVEESRVGDVKAIWFEGAFHELQYSDPDGTLRVEMERVVDGNTLAWEKDSITFRLETSLPKDEAVKVAESVR